MSKKRRNRLLRRVRHRLSRVGVGSLLSNVPSFNPTVGALAIQRPQLALATLVAITPVLVVFLFAQRFLVSGMLAGATKE